MNRASISRVKTESSLFTTPTPTVLVTDMTNKAQVRNAVIKMKANPKLMSDSVASWTQFAPGAYRLANMVNVAEFSKLCNQVADSIELVLEEKIIDRIQTEPNASKKKLLQDTFDAASNSWKKFDSESEAMSFLPLRWMVFAITGDVKTKDYKLFLGWLGLPDDGKTIAETNTVIPESLHINNYPNVVKVVVEKVVEKIVEKIIERPVEKVVYVDKIITETKETKISEQVVTNLNMLYLQTSSNVSNAIELIASELKIELKAKRFCDLWQTIQEAHEDVDLQRGFMKTCFDMFGQDNELRTWLPEKFARLDEQGF